MQYLCPKCGNFMTNVSLAVYPPKSYYLCISCKYTSKIVEEACLYTELPKELQQEDDDEIQPNL